MFPLRSLSAAALVLALAACGPKVSGVGDQLQSFIVSTSSVAKPTCLVCANGGKLVVMAIGDPADAGFREDLSALQRIAGERPSLGVFAIATRIADGHHVPYDDEMAAYESIAAMRRELSLEFPVALVPKDVKKEDYASFRDTYRLLGKRTVYFAGRDRKVRWAGAIEGGAQIGELEKAITAAL